MRDNSVLVSSIIVHNKMRNDRVSVMGILIMIWCMWLYSEVSTSCSSFSWFSLSLMLGFKWVAEIMETFPLIDSLNHRKVQLWISVKCSRCRVLRNLAPVVLWKIKTSIGANELFSSVFVSSFNQSLQVTTSAVTYAAALSLQKAQIHNARTHARGVCVCVLLSQSTETLFLSAERRAWNMLSPCLKDHSASNVNIANDTVCALLGLLNTRGTTSRDRDWMVMVVHVRSTWFAFVS